MEEKVILGDPDQPVLGFSIQPSLGFTENGLKKKTHPVRNSSVCENDLLMPEVKEK